MALIPASTLGTILNEASNASIVDAVLRYLDEDEGLAYCNAIGKPKGLWVETNTKAKPYLWKDDKGNLQISNGKNAFTN